MAENLVPNASFEMDWGVDRSHRALVFPEDQVDPIDTTFGEIFTPSAGWLSWFRHEPGTWDRPEIRDAWDYIDARRVRSGRKGMLVFNQFRRNDAGLMVRVRVEPGRTYRAEVFAHAWSNHTIAGYEDTWHDGEVSSGIGDAVISVPVTHDVPYIPTGDAWHDARVNFHFQIGLNPYGELHPFTEEVKWGPEMHCYNGYSQPLTVEIKALSDWMVVILRGYQLWPFTHNDAYWEDVSLRLVEAPVEERTYHRTVVLMSPTVTVGDALSIVEEHWDQRWTYSFSADDAGINASQTLSRRVLAVEPEGWPGDLAEFFETNYPGVILEELGEDGPPPPPPPPPAEEDRIPVPTLHLQTMDQMYWADCVRQVRPDICKVFGASDVLGVMRQSPETLVVHRHHTPDYNGIFDAPTAEIGARRYIAQFIDGVRNTCDQIEREFPNKEWPLFLVEGLNETYPSLNEPVIKRARDLDIAHLQVLHQEEPRVAGAVGQIAVGNPHETEYHLLLPLAQACMEYDAWMGYHGYWYANAVEDGLEWSWQWLAGRWTEIDEVFTTNDYFVKWYSGEAGVVGGQFIPADSASSAVEFEMIDEAGWSHEATLGETGGPIWRDEKPHIRFVPHYTSDPRLLRALDDTGGFNPAELEAQRDGWFSLLPHDGWKASTCYNGDWSRYETAIYRFCQMAREWNALNSGRYWGPCLFTTGAPYTGWPSFQIKEAQMRALETVAHNLRSAG